MLRLTPMVRNLIMINSIVFFAQLLIRELPIMNYLALWNIGTGNFRPYQLFTYMFAHGDGGHIFFNMIGLVFFGPILESLWGSMRFLAFYLICGIGAGLFNMGMDLFLGGASFGLMLGASGAVYGIMTAFGFLFPNTEIQLLIPPVSIKAKYLVAGFAAIALYSAFNRSANDNTAHFAHLGGIVIAIIQLQFWRFKA